MSEILSKELKAYDANHAELLVSHEGQFVVIHDDDLLGTFDTQMDAIATGYRELGNVPFLVKQITKVDVPLSFVSNLLGV
ncbi:MAG: hypothetical protein ABIE42_03465 [Candidatus Eisenbacteria bacterium]